MGTRPLGYPWLLAVLAAPPTDECIDWPFGGHQEGYGRLGVFGKRMRATRLACELAHGPCPPDKTEAAHSCGRPICCNPAHLRWATPKENAADKIGHGTAMCRAKLTPAEVSEIRSLYQRGARQVDLASQFNVGQSTISRVVLHQHWAWVA